MSEVSQGPGWWQASDLKWYPPELHADYVAPPPPATRTLPPPPEPVPPTQPPVPAKGLSGQRKIVVLAGLALLAFADLVLIPVTNLLAALVLVAIVIIVVTIALRSGQSGAPNVMSVIATVLVVVVLPAAAGILVNLLFGVGGGSSGVAGSTNGGYPSTQGGPPGASNPASGYTWAQLSHDYPGLRTPCTKQPNTAGRLQCYWSHYSNVGSAESSAKQLPAGALRDNLLVNFDFYRKNYPQVASCTKATLTTDFGCISGAQSLDTYDDQIASLIQAGLAGR